MWSRPQMGGGGTLTLGTVSLGAATSGIQDLSKISTLKMVSAYWILAGPRLLGMISGPIISIAPEECARAAAVSQPCVTIAFPASANGSATRRSLPGYGCSTGSPARIPRQKPIASGSEKRTGAAAG